MGLKPCLICKEMISEDADRCVHCGEESPFVKPSLLVALVIIIVGVGFVILMNL